MPTFESNVLGLLSRIAEALEAPPRAEEIHEIQVSDVRTRLRLCRDCYHFAPDSAERTRTRVGAGNTPGGECRCHPPAVLLASGYSPTTEFPRVIETAWCGEFEPRPGGTP